MSEETKSLSQRLRNGDHLATLQGDDQTLADLHSLHEEAATAIDRLSRWKAEALTLLIAWSDLADEAFKLLGEPPHLLGRSGVDIVREAMNTEWVQGVVQEMIAEDAQDDGTYCEVCGFTYAPDESCWKH